MASDITIPSDLGAWGINYKATYDASGRQLTSHNVHNLAIGKAATFVSDYGTRIRGMLTEIEDSTDRVESLRSDLATMRGWTAANWSVDVAAARTQDLIGIMGRQGGSAAPWYDGISTIHGYSYANPISTFNTMAEALKAVPVAVPGEQPNIFIVDGAHYLRKSDGEVLSLPPHAIQPAVVKPTDKDVSEMRDVVQKALDSVTQVAQSKQAYLQDLVTSLNRFLAFATNIQERRERDLQDMSSRIG